MRKIIFLCLLLFVIINQINAQYVNVKVNSTPVCGEEWITINPKNPSQVVAGTNKLFNNPQGSMGYFYSTNSGNNWSEGTLISQIAQTGSDPVVLVDTLGNYYYICVTNWMITPPYGDKLLCQKSTNGGMNWDNGTLFALLNKFDDMPMGCIDHSHSQYGNNLYVTWTLYDTVTGGTSNDSAYVYFCKSSNCGNNFSNPIRISKIAGCLTNAISIPEGPVPCTGPNGEIYVCYPHNEQVLFTRSTDGGNTWLNNEVIVSSLIGGWLYTFSPVSACDISNSQYRGNVYICFSDLRNGTSDRDIWFTKSTNNGDNWSTLLRVNNDSPGHVQTLPWICVDEITGYIWIIFYDGRNYSNGSRYDTYVARSTDGGSTFQNVKVSNSTSSALTGYWLGDYIGISAYNDIVRPIWTTSVAYGNCNLWTAILDSITIGVNTLSTNVPDKFSLSQNYPNPFNPTTNIKFKIKESGFVTLKVYDILGKEIMVLVNEKLKPGEYETQFPDNSLTNFQLPSGVYYYKLIAGDYYETKKMILIK